MGMRKKINAKNKILREEAKVRRDKKKLKRKLKAEEATKGKTVKKQYCKKTNNVIELYLSGGWPRYGVSG